jgi:hypothetical protein
VTPAADGGDGRGQLPTCASAAGFPFGRLVRSYPFTHASTAIVGSLPGAVVTFG